MAILRDWWREDIMTENEQQKLIKKAAIYIDKKQFNKATKCLDEAYVENGKFNALIFY